MPAAVRAALQQLDAAHNAPELSAANHPGFERIATVAGWMRPPPTRAFPPRGSNWKKIPDPAASPPEFRRRRIADAAAPWGVLPSLDSFPPHRISRRYPVAQFATEGVANDTCAALQARVFELAEGADQARDRDELEILFRTANPRFFVVNGQGLSRPELLLAEEKCARLRGGVAGAPSTEERLVRVYWDVICPVLDCHATLARNDRSGDAPPMTNAHESSTPAVRKQDDESTPRTPVRATPVWDATARILSFRGLECKRFKKPALNQERILAVFQEDGWPDAIDDPLQPGKLSITVDSLKDRMEHITFSLNGAGNGVCWRPL